MEGMRRDGWNVEVGTAFVCILKIVQLIALLILVPSVCPDMLCVITTLTPQQYPHLS